jgi:outer membrane protein
MVKIKIVFLWVSFLFSAWICRAQQSIEQVVPLDSAFVWAVQHSTHLKISQAAAHTAEQAVAVAQNSRLPHIDVGVSALYLGNGTIFDRSFANAQTAPIPHFGNNFSIDASYVVFAGGAISTSIQKAELQSQVAALSHVQNSMDIRFLVAGFYLDLYKLRNQKKVFDKNIEQTNEVIQQVKARIVAGMSLDNDLTRYELELQNLKLARIEIENNCSILNQQLQIVLGLPNHFAIVPDSSVQHLGQLPEVETQLLQQALANRPEIKMQDLQRELARKNVQLAQSNRLPQVALVAGNHLDGPITIEVPPIDKNFNYWFVGVGIKYNLASVYQSQKNIELANRALMTANYIYDAELEQTRVSLFAAFKKFEEAHDKLAVYEMNFKLASENYQVINNRYLNDLALITDMLDASNIKLRSELQVVNAKLDVVYHSFKLKREIGTL